jgi:protein-tyrosine-phosphatase
MAAVLLREHLSDQGERWALLSSGTHVIEGMPMSWRTRDAIEGLGLEVPYHRSRQATVDELDRADLVIALACEHVSWMRRVHPRAAPRTATRKRLARDLPAGAEPLAVRVESLHLETVTLERGEDVIDPAGGDIDVFHETAREIQSLIHTLAPRLQSD